MLLSFMLLFTNYIHYCFSKMPGSREQCFHLYASVSRKESSGGCCLGANEQRSVYEDPVLHNKQAYLSIK